MIRSGMGVMVRSDSTRVISAIWLLYVVNNLDRIVMSFAGPTIMASLAMSPARFGIVLSSFGLGYTLAHLPGGMLSDRWGVKPLLVIGPLFWALFTGATGLVGTISGFVIVRFCFGLAEGVSAPATVQGVAEHFRSQRRAAMLSVINSGSMVGAVIGGPLVTKLVGAYGWRGAFFAMAAPAVGASLVSHLLLPAPKSARLEPGAPSKRDYGAFRGTMAQPGLWILCLGQFAFDFAFWGYTGWLPGYLALQRHLDLKSVGWLGGATYAIGFLGLVLGGSLGTAFHRFRAQLTAASLMLASLSLFLAYRAATLTWALIGISGAAFFLYASQGPKGAINLDLAPDHARGTFLGLLNMIGRLGGVVAPAAIGFMVSATGTFAGGFGLMAAAFCIAAISTLALLPLLAVRAKSLLAVA